MKLDYICRQDVLEEIDEIIGYINFTSPYQDDNDLIVRGLERARDAIECAATADVRADIRAQWEWKDIFCEGSLMLCCSNCLETEGARESANYCPNCGAKMECGQLSEANRYYHAERNINKLSSEDLY